MTDVIIYLECCVPNFPLNYKLLPFSNSCDEFKVTKCCTKSISLLTLGTVRFYGYGGGGGGGGGGFGGGEGFKNIGNGGFVFQMQ